MKHKIDGAADVVVVGAAGLVGRWVLLEATRAKKTVVAVVRNAPERAAELARFVDARGGDSRLVRFAEGDVTQPGLGLDAHDTEIVEASRGLVNAAARYAFGLPYADARAANVEGAVEVARLAARMRSLGRLVHLGGYRYGHATADERARAGAYERTKLEGVEAVEASASALGVPVTFVHPSSIVGDSRTGETTQLVGIGEMVRTLARGEMHAQVGNARTFVPIVPIDYVARFVVAAASEAARTGGPGAVHHYVLDPSTPPLFELVRTAAKHLGVRAPRFAVPVVLARRLPRALTKTDPEALGFLSGDRYSTESADTFARQHGLTMPGFDDYFGRWIEHLVRTRFLEEARAA